MGKSKSQKAQRKRYKQRQKAKQRIANNQANFEDLSCFSKRTYLNARSASAAAASSSLNFGKMFRSYYCRLCGKWHLTSH